MSAGFGCWQGLMCNAGVVMRTINCHGCMQAVLGVTDCIPVAQQEVETSLQACMWEECG